MLLSLADQRRCRITDDKKCDDDDDDDDDPRSSGSHDFDALLLHLRGSGGVEAQSAPLREDRHFLQVHFDCANVFALPPARPTVRTAPRPCVPPHVSTLMITGSRPASGRARQQGRRWVTSAVRRSTK